MRILLAIIAILLYQVYTIAVRPYRLGDFVRQTGGFEHSAWRTIYAQINRDSLVYKYYKATNNASSSMNIKVLSEIVGSSEGDNCVIHLRLGDVIDNNKLTVDDLWENDYTDKLDGHSWRGGTCTTVTRFKTCEAYGFVHTRHFFERIANLLPEHIIIISGSHMRTNHPEKSQDYIQRVRSLLEARGKRCDVHWNRAPDDDFAAMCNAKYFVGSGGGFSQLAALVVEFRGGKVIK